MNSQPHLNYTLFNSFYPEQRAAYPTYEHSYEPAYMEEHDIAEYSFLPKTSGFFDAYASNPLDVTRQSTEHTDSDATPPGSVTYHSYPHQEYYSAPYLNAKTIGMAPQFATNSRNRFNSFNQIPMSRAFPDHSSHIHAQKCEESEESIHELKKEESFVSGEESEEAQEIVINAQLQSLLDSQVWSEEKDQLLLKLGVQYKCDWKKIAKRFNHKKITPHFLKIRYKELTYAPLQRRVKFAHREDLMIAKYFEKYGSNWAQMSTHFKDRTPIMLKNRYYSFIRKRDLLDLLTHEVKEIEKEHHEVDTLKDHESEKYIDQFNIPREGGSRNPQTQIDNVCFEMENSFKNELHERITPASQVANHENHLIFGYEKNYNNKVEEKVQKASLVADRNERSKGTKERKEVQILKDRIKSLQSLYLTTKSELEKMKTKNS